MPVRRQGTLLAGMAALLGLCTAGAGCQSSNVCNSCCGTMPGGQAVVSTSPATGVSMMRPIASTGTRRSLFGRRSTSSEPTLVHGSAAVHPAASVLRPVPAGVDASAWAPVQRIGETASLGTSSAVTMDRAQPVAYAPVVRTDAEAPLVPIPAGVAPPPPVAGGDEGIKNNVLPPPRIVPNGNGNGNRVAIGYPELPAVGVAHAPDVPKEFAKRALSAYVIEPPDFLLIDAGTGVLEAKTAVRTTVLVRPDGTIGLSTLPPIFVAGLTIEQAKQRIAEVVNASRFDGKRNLRELVEGLRLDVAEFNSKFYYVITDGGGYGAQIFRLPCTGNETVLDALAQVQGLPAVASKKKIWVARATPDHSHNPYILPVDWCGIVQRGSAATNYQLYPGDRVFVHSDALIRADSALGKFLAPIERLLGVTLLGSSVVNSIRSGSNFNQGNFGNVR